nr:PREDICTED: valacyclovir hydrolase-like [Balearica regulorum gibbericeps]
MKNKNFNQLFHPSADFEIHNLLLVVGEQQQQKRKLYKHCCQFLKLAKTPVTFQQHNTECWSQALKFKKFSLLGWSDGGITALIAAAKYPTLIHKLVVWGANASVTQEDVRIYHGIRDVSKWSEKVKKPLEEMYGHKYFAKTCEKWVDGISRFAEKSDGNICQELLPDIKCPTFIIHGEKDPLVPQAHAEYIHKHIKGSQLLLMPEGKHNLHLRFAEDFNRQVEDFLQ